MVWSLPIHKSDVYSLAFRVYILARAFGFWPFRVVYNAKTKSSTVSMNILDWLWFFGAIFIHLVWGWISWQAIDHNTSHVWVLLSQIIQMSTVSIWILSLIMDFFNRKRIWSIIVGFNEFDNEVRFTK